MSSECNIKAKNGACFEIETIFKIGAGLVVEFDGISSLIWTSDTILESPNWPGLIAPIHMLIR